MSNDTEVIEFLDNSDEESEETKHEKKKKEDKSIDDLALGIRNGGWLRFVKSFYVRCIHCCLVL